MIFLKPIFSAILERKIGYSAEISIEESPLHHKLQTKPLCELISRESSTEKKFPEIIHHLASNSTHVPAVFVLRLTKPLPVCTEQAQEIGKITGIELANIGNESNLIELLAAQCLPGRRRSGTSGAFYAALPDQSHCYWLNSSEDTLKGILVEKIAFTHPTHVPKVLMCLRKQVRFNVIISSIIRQMDVLGEFGFLIVKCIFNFCFL